MASVSSDPLLISMRSQGAREQNSLTTAVCNSDVIIPDVGKTRIRIQLRCCPSVPISFKMRKISTPPTRSYRTSSLLLRKSLRRQFSTALRWKEQTMLIEADIIKAKILQIGQGRSVSRPAIYQRIGQFPLLYPFNIILKPTFVKYFLSVYS